MHISRPVVILSRWLPVLAMALVVVGGCRRNDPPAAMLADTPEEMRPPVRPKADAIPPAVDDAPAGQESVQALRERIERQNRLFSSNTTAEAPLSRSQRASTDSAGDLSHLPSPRPPARAEREPGGASDKPMSRPPEGAARDRAEPAVSVKEPPSRTPPPAIVPDVPVIVPATQPQPPAPQYAKPVDRVTTTTTTDADVMAREFARRLKEHPTDAAAHFYHQIFRFLRDESIPDLGSLSPLPPDDREMLSVALDGISDWIRKIQTDPNALPSRKLAPLLRMAERLRELTELSIPTMSLCRRVDGFGIYEPMALSFRAGLEHETIIYCEVENFTSRLNEKQLWETKLSMEAVLYNSAGDAILRGKDNVPIDLCRNRRRDFFVVKRLKLPATLAASRYILKVTIVDEQAKRVAENSLNLMMMAQ
ncbi:hypothetical protein [Humisphaera borealis]|uniref:Uncharacterized protein n=1 Tax=Humisphaera borealis TaxID=2807512 RepID=A0A7M2WSX7_9BACT|nr:hypothetical protein [Humisphaera borealis]QOV88533.1 hypothetical protein IPV69_20145 [Humisphaera borealis]